MTESREISNADVQRDGEAALELQRFIQDRHPIERPSISDEISISEIDASMRSESAYEQSQVEETTPPRRSIFFDYLKPRDIILIAATSFAALAGTLSKEIVVRQQRTALDRYASTLPGPALPPAEPPPLTDGQLVDKLISLITSNQYLPDRHPSPHQVVEFLKQHPEMEHLINNTSKQHGLEEAGYQALTPTDIALRVWDIAVRQSEALDKSDFADYSDYSYAEIVTRLVQFGGRPADTALFRKMLEHLEYEVGHPHQTSGGTTQAEMREFVKALKGVKLYTSDVRSNTPLEERTR